MRARRAEGTLAAAVLLLSCAVILAHLGLVRAGGWGSDEFYNFVRFQHTGLTWFFVRLLQWSPRPASDTLLYLYALAVGHWRMPLIAPFLVVVWSVLIIGTFAAGWQRGSAGLLPRLTVAATVLAMFLLGHRINYLFYWPMGTAPYLLDLTGITVVVFQVVFAGTSRPAGRLACAIGLGVAATSSETGLFFALPFTAAMLLLELPGSQRQRPGQIAPITAALVIAVFLAYIVAVNPWQGIGDASPYFHNVASAPITASSEAALAVALVFTIAAILLPRPRASGWYLVPLGVSLATGACLAYIVQTNPARGIDQAGAYFHSIPRSLIATLAGILPDLLGGDGSPTGLSTVEWLATACLLFVGFIWGCRRGNLQAVPARQFAALFAGLGGCFVLTIFTSYYEYGTRLHEPQPEFRKCLTVLGLLAAARLVAPLMSWQRMNMVGPAALICAVAIGGIERAPGILGDYRLVPAIREARAATWRSGQDRATDTLRYVEQPRGHLVYGMIPALPGHFILHGPGVDPWMDGLMEFFDKRSIEFSRTATPEQPNASHP